MADLQERANKYQDERNEILKKLTEKYGFDIVYVIEKRQSQDTGAWFDVIVPKIVEVKK